MVKSIAKKTGDLFGSLFVAFDEINFLKSVDLFKKRFEENNFDLNYFKDKKCLDLGCGGGRYSIALSLLGAKHVTGVDVSETGIADAKLRAKKLNITNTDFVVYDGDKLPFKDEEFECVIWSGVLMHMENPELAMKEVSRIVKKSGMIYMLVYATGGIRWPMVNQLRNLSSFITLEKIDLAFKTSGLDVNKRRTYLDDLYVPLIDFYSFDRLKKLLKKNGFDQCTRWVKGRLDHEENMESYIKDLDGFNKLFEEASSLKEVFSATELEVLSNAKKFIVSVVDYAKSVNELFLKGELTEQQAREIIIGQGHHRIIAYKSN
jgi:ubiquinone/menaquinone biosynthesis C-methylase UbiE